MARIQEQLARLVTMSPAELRKTWVIQFRSEPPRLSPDLMRHALGYRMQEKMFGKLPARIARQLRPSSKANRFASTDRIPVGSQLIRSWNGRTLSVEVMKKGFLFEARTYSSLSAIAREVTGTHCSGPRFFGVKRR